MPLFNSKPDTLSPNGSTSAAETILDVLTRRFRYTVEPAEMRVESAIMGAGFGQIIIEQRTEEERAHAAAAHALQNTVDFVPEPIDMQSEDTAGPVQPAGPETGGQLSPQLAALGYTTVSQNAEELN